MNRMVQLIQSSLQAGNPLKKDQKVPPLWEGGQKYWKESGRGSTRRTCLFSPEIKEKQYSQKTTEAACTLIFDPSSNRSYYSSEITNGLSKWNKNDKYQKHISDIYTTIAGHSDSGTLLPRPPWSQQKTLMSFLLHFILIWGREGVTRLCGMERSNIRKRKRNYFQLFWVFFVFAWTLFFFCLSHRHLAGVWVHV